MSLKRYAVAMVLADRFRKYHLPRIIDIERRVDEGARIEDRDIDFLKQVCGEMRANLPTVIRYPMCRELAEFGTDMYLEITSEALALETSHRETAFQEATA